MASLWFIANHCWVIGAILWLIEAQWFHCESLEITDWSLGLICGSLMLNGFVVGHSESLVGRWGQFVDN